MYVAPINVIWKMRGIETSKWDSSNPPDHKAFLGLHMYDVVVRVHNSSCCLPHPSSSVSSYAGGGTMHRTWSVPALKVQGRPLDALETTQVLTGGGPPGAMQPSCPCSGTDPEVCQECSPLR